MVTGYNKNESAKLESDVRNNWENNQECNQERIQENNHKGKFTKTVKRAMAVMLAVVCVASSGYSVYAASAREAWNNAASSTTTETTLLNGSVVYSNVYADANAWSTWKTAWETIRTNYEMVALTPGTDATQVNFAWYSHTVETPAVRLLDSLGNPIGTTFYGNQGATPMSVTEGTVTTNLYANKVTMTNLTEETTYHYQYFLNGGWSATYTYTTEKTENFSVLYVGDPQIGASKGQTATETNSFTNQAEYYARNDAFNWNSTITNAVTANPKLSFILSSGDQINQTSVTKVADNLEQQVEYSGFLYTSALRSLPIATAIGNHDNGSANYQNHFNNPNAYTEETGASVAGNDYYFSYGNALFVVINSNNSNCQTHKDLINEALAAYPDVTWKVLMFHQDIYGSGADHSDTDGMILRTQLTTIIDEAGFDAVLQGHDHTYSRSYQLDADANTYAAYDKTADVASADFKLANASCYDILTNIEDKNKVINPTGTVYFEANSSTGSKFYQLIDTQQDYIAARSQTWRPTYSVIDIDEVSLTVKTYDAATNQELVADGGIETAYTIVKSVNKSTLETKIADADTTLLDTSIYTEASVANLIDVTASAKVIFTNAESTSLMVTSAYTSVASAISALVLKVTDTTLIAPAASSTNAVVSSTNPATGDTGAMLAFSITLSIVSAGVLALMILGEKRRKKRQ